MTKIRDSHVLTARDAGLSGQIGQIQNWCAVNGIDAHHVHRVEMYARGGQLIARIFEYDRDGQGHRFVRNEGDDEPAKRDPYTVTVEAPIPLTVPMVIVDGEELPEAVA